VSWLGTALRTILATGRPAGFPPFALAAAGSSQ